MASDKVNFNEAAEIAQAFKSLIRAAKAWDELTPAAKESLDQIATAIARTVSGDGVHWDGIVGFAQAARPTSPNDPAPTVDLERGIRQMVRELPTRGGNAT